MTCRRKCVMKCPPYSIRERERRQRKATFSLVVLTAWNISLPLVDPCSSTKFNISSKIEKSKDTLSGRCFHQAHWLIFTFYNAITYFFETFSHTIYKSRNCFVRYCCRLKICKFELLSNHIQPALRMNYSIFNHLSPHATHHLHTALILHELLILFHIYIFWEKNIIGYLHTNLFSD